MVANTEQSDPGMAVPRDATGERVLYTFLFVLILHMVGAVLGLVVVFELVYALVTTARPSMRVTHFANRLVRYAFAICLYITYNSEQPPFPFADLPDGHHSPVEAHR